MIFFHKKICISRFYQFIRMLHIQKVRPICHKQNYLSIYRISLLLFEEHILNYFLLYSFHHCWSPKHGEVLGFIVEVPTCDLNLAQWCKLFWESNFQQNHTDLDFWIQLYFDILNNMSNVLMPIVYMCWVIKGQRSQKMFCKYLTFYWSDDNRGDYQNCRSRYSLSKRSNVFFT